MLSTYIKNLAIAYEVLCRVQGTEDICLRIRSLIDDAITNEEEQSRKAKETFKPKFPLSETPDGDIPF